LTNKQIAILAIPIVAVLLGVSAFATSFQTEGVDVPSVADRSTVTGWVTLTVFDSNGIEKLKVQNHNLIVDGGLDEMAQSVFGVGGVGSTVFTFLEIGTSGTAPTATDTTIGASACARIQDVAPDVNSAVSGETSVSVIVSFDGTSCAGGIQEAGIFNAITGNEMLARSTFGTVTIGAGDTLNVNYTVTIT